MGGGDQRGFRIPHVVQLAVIFRDMRTQLQSITTEATQRSNDVEFQSEQLCMKLYNLIDAHAKLRSVDCEPKI